MIKPLIRHNPESKAIEMSRSGLIVRAVAVGFALSLLGAGTALAAVPRSDLAVVRMDPDATTPGGVTTVRGFVTNKGPDPLTSPFYVVITLPEGVASAGPFFPTSCQGSPSSTRCAAPSRPDWASSGPLPL
ncbi:hypothetical protein ACIBG7_40475 [Nonomuraea sp. NPDC050328]|uniref:hypothetical protein n=1 Tax=Nonomuraea sp. NPDC050328 TaxID=3364361 RepID=UPI0037A221FA